MLGGVDAEAVDPQAAQVGEVCGDRRTDGITAGVEVGQAHQFAGLDIAPVTVVADVLAAAVEVLVLEVPGVGVLRVRRAAGPGARAGRHVVDDGVRHDLHSGRVTALHHGRERIAVPEASGDLVTDRLVGGPPLVALNVFGGGRDLHVAVAGRTERVRAGPGHSVVLPLEQGGGDGLLARWGRLGGPGGEGGDTGGGEQAGQGRASDAGTQLRLLRSRVRMWGPHPAWVATRLATVGDFGACRHGSEHVKRVARISSMFLKYIAGQASCGTGHWSRWCTATTATAPARSAQSA